METEFWGVEVKMGEPLQVSPGDGRVLHLSQASLGEHENKKGKENVSLFVNLDGKKLVLGTLITNKLPQHQYDLLFDRDFELSHNWKSGSVYFYGYKAINSSGKDESTEGESDESEEVIPRNLRDRGRPESSVKLEKSESTIRQEKAESKTEQEKPESKTEQEKSNVMQEKPESKVEQGKPADERCNVLNEESDAGKIVETHKNVNPQEDDESTFEDMMSEDEDYSQVVESKKRPVEVESATKTPVPTKKAKAAPQETDGNKSAPLPVSEANKQTLKPLKLYPCKICKKLFSTEQGVESHTKDKHGDGKKS